MRLLILLAIAAIAATPEDPGRKIYTGKCARCHKLYDPAKYDDKTGQVASLPSANFPDQPMEGIIVVG